MIRDNEKRRAREMKEMLKQICEFNALHWAEVPLVMRDKEKALKDRAAEIKLNWAEEDRRVKERKSELRNTQEFKTEYRNLLRENQ